MNNYNSNWKKLLEFRNLQEKLENIFCTVTTNYTYLYIFRTLDLTVLSLLQQHTYIFTPFWEEYMQKFYTLQDLSILYLTFLAPKAYLNTKICLNMSVNLIYIINSGVCLSYIKCTSESSSPILQWI